MHNKAIAYPTDMIKSKMDTIYTALVSAKSEMSSQASLLLEMGEEEMAQSYSERAKAVENFMNNNKK